MIADLTRYPPALMAELRELNKVAIPVLAIYKPGDGKNPIVLEDLLTESQVINALEQAGPAKAATANSGLGNILSATR
jgi:thiol:disulfide interchange protein